MTSINPKKRSRSYSITSNTSSAAVTPARSITSSSSPSQQQSKKKKPKAQPAGLRLFSMRVCEQVKAKRITTYREVADEVVKAEHARLQETGQRPKGVLDEKKKKDDDKNIRRRIYDALNVLIAMEIVTKDPKEKIIRWKGFPSMNYSDSAKLLQEKEELLSRIQEKKEALQDLLVQNVCFRNLTLRNERNGVHLDDPEDVPDMQKEGGGGGGGGVGGKIPLPFIVVNTHQRAQINCEMNEDRTDVKFDFDMPFEIFNDSHILENLGLNKITHRDLATMYPPDILNYCVQNNLLGRILTDQPLGPGGDSRSSSSYPPPPPPHHASTYPLHHPAHRPPPGHRPPPPSHHPNHPPPPYVSHSHPVPPPGGVYNHSSGGGGPPPPPSSSSSQTQPASSHHSRQSRGGGGPPPSSASEGGSSSSRQMYSSSGHPNENFSLW